jgi:hypothetical protein
MTPLIVLVFAVIFSGSSFATFTPARAESLLGQVNNPPVAVDDAYSVRHDDTLVIDATGGVKANDSDPDGDLLSVVFSVPSNGNLIPDNSTGAFEYTPLAGFVGTDTFTYTVFDDGVPQLSDDATITITVYDNPPVANDDSYTMSQDSVLNIDATGGLLANDADPDFDSLTIVPAPPSNGTIAIDVDGAFTYTPFAGFAGTDSFIYTVIESGTIGLSDDANVTIFVQGPEPTATTEPEPTTTPDTTTTVAPTKEPVPTATTESSGGVTDLPDTGGAPLEQGGSNLRTAGLIALALAGAGFLLRRHTRLN